MDINSLVYTDEALKLIDEGTWIDDLKGAPGVSFKVQGFRSKAARDLMALRQAEARAKNQGEPVTEEQLAEITKEILYECVLHDWKGLTDGGKTIAYSKELAKKWITSRNGERFAALVIQAAHRVDGYAHDMVEEVLKN